MTSGLFKMAEMEVIELKELVATMAQQNARLITALSERPLPAVPQVQNVAAAAPQAVRENKLAQLSQALRKSTKIKDFRDSPECKIREWLRRFDQEILALRKMYGLAEELNRNEWVVCIRDKLDYDVQDRLETEFRAKEPVYTWEEITEVQMKATLTDIYGKGETDVSAVMCQFGPNRLRKTSDMSVAKFYHMWLDQLPECMLPVSAEENAKFVDLIKRSLFYFCLDDTYLQEKLCEIKEEPVTLQLFMKEAIEAEMKRKSFNEIGVISSHLDSSSGISVINGKLRLM